MTFYLCPLGEKGRKILCARTPVKYAFVSAQAAYHPVSLLCHVLKESRSGYYRWSQRIPSQRAQADKKLLKTIRRVHAEHRGHAGALKTWKVLKRQGIA